MKPNRISLILTETQVKKLMQQVITENIKQKS